MLRRRGLGLRHSRAFERNRVEVLRLLLVLLCQPLFLTSEDCAATYSAADGGRRYETCFCNV